MFMIQAKLVETGRVNVKSTVRLTHPRADMLTVQIGHDAQCNFPLSVEFALSKGYYFLTESLPDFAQYGVLVDDRQSMTYYNMRSEHHDGHVMVYRNVPITVFAKFLNMYAAS